MQLGGLRGGVPCAVLSIILPYMTFIALPLLLWILYRSPGLTIINLTLGFYLSRKISSKSRLILRYIPDILDTVIRYFPGLIYGFGSKHFDAFSSIAAEFVKIIHMFFCTYPYLFPDKFPLSEQ